jgi:TetR/AcrR family acrAB operon transcriptional repressor
MARRTKADAQATRAGLLDAAEQLFQARGVSRTSLNDIAVAAGTTRGAIYWHFKDKADLFNAMMDRVTLPLEQTLNLTQMVCSSDPVADIRHAMLEALRLIATDAQTRRVLYIATHQVEYTEELGDVQKRRLTVHGECVERNRRSLAQAFARQGVAPPVPLECAAHGLQALVEGLVQRWLFDAQAFDLLETGRNVIDVYLNGLGLRTHVGPWVHSPITP